MTISCLWATGFFFFSFMTFFHLFFFFWVHGVEFAYEHFLVVMLRVIAESHFSTKTGLSLLGVESFDGMWVA